MYHFLSSALLFNLVFCQGAIALVVLQLLQLLSNNNNEIHCLKTGEAAHAAASLISDATSKMLDPAGEAESNDEDPFADIDSEDELGNNE